jgi:hypothetical protein
MDQYLVLIALNRGIKWDLIPLKKLNRGLNTSLYHWIGGKWSINTCFIPLTRKHMEINICLPTILMWTAELHILDPCPYVYWLLKLNIRKGKPGHSGHEWWYVVSTYCTDSHRFCWISMNKSEPDVVNQLEDNWERVANLQHTTRRVYGSLESVTAVFHDLCHS